MKLGRVWRVIGWLLIAFIVYAIFRSPDEAANIIVIGVQGIGRGVGAVFTFFDAILSRSGGTAAAGALSSAAALRPA